jgi:predicted DCC family thiol-disulfide oxidoreductase YuxK
MSFQAAIMSTCETDLATRTEPAVAESAVDHSGPIIFFDGVCGLCNTSVDQVIRWDRRGVFKFAPLQGETARQLLTSADTQRLDSVALLDHGRIYRKSAAAVRILWQLGALPSIAGTLMWLVPKPIRDWGYGVIARNRYRWFGKKETCRMPTPAERARFLP